MPEVVTPIFQCTTAVFSPNRLPAKIKTSRPFAPRAIPLISLFAAGVAVAPHLKFCDALQSNIPNAAGCATALRPRRPKTENHLPSVNLSRPCLRFCHSRGDTALPLSSTDVEFSASPPAPPPLGVGSQPVEIMRVSTAADIMDVGIFRNAYMDAAAMVANQIDRNESLKQNPMKSILEGVSVSAAIGLIFGTVVGIQTGDLVYGLKYGCTLALVPALIVGAQNAMGKRVYIMTEAEASHRILEDYCTAIRDGDDVGFIARMVQISNDETNIDVSKFDSCHGLVACADCKLRNDPSSTKRYGTLPTHVHIRNVSVDSLFRRRGIASSLVQAIEYYAVTECNANMVTLEVEDDNVGAIALYQSLGYEGESIGNMGAQAKYGRMVFGRSIMTKTL